MEYNSISQFAFIFLFRIFAEKSSSLKDSPIQMAPFTPVDADSICEKYPRKEGAFYAWDPKILKNILGNDYLLFNAFLNANNSSYWAEEEKLVLFRTTTEEKFAIENNLNLKEFILKIDKWRSLLE